MTKISYDLCHYFDVSIEKIKVLRVPSKPKWKKKKWYLRNKDFDAHPLTTFNCKVSYSYSTYLETYVQGEADFTISAMEVVIYTRPFFLQGTQATATL